MSSVKSPALWVLVLACSSCHSKHERAAVAGSAVVTLAFDAAPTVSPKVPTAPAASSIRGITADSADSDLGADVDAGANAEALEFVSAICAAAIHHEKGRVLVGCRDCPPFTSRHSKPDGHVAIDPDPFYPLEASYKGAFSAPGADEVAAIFLGCESHADNSGGTLLATRTPKGFRVRSYYSGVHPTSCLVYRRADDRDLLVCQWYDAHQFTLSIHVFTFDVTRATAQEPTAGMKPLLTLQSDAAMVCVDMNPELGVTEAEVLGIRVEDRNQDEQKDVLIDIAYRRTPYSEALKRRVKQSCDAAPKHQDDIPRIDLTSILGAPQTRTLEFLADSKGFKASAETASFLKSVHD